MAALRSTQIKYIQKPSHKYERSRDDVLKEVFHTSTGDEGTYNEVLDIKKRIGIFPVSIPQGSAYFERTGRKVIVKGLEISIFARTRQIPAGTSVDSQNDNIVVWLILDKQSNKDTAAIIPTTVFGQDAGNSYWLNPINDERFTVLKSWAWTTPFLPVGASAQTFYNSSLTDVVDMNIEILYNESGDTMTNNLMLWAASTSGFYQAAEATEAATHIMIKTRTIFKG